MAEIPVGPGTEALPPPGDERREVLKERAEVLSQAAESQPVEGGRIDPKRLRVENELAQHFNELEVTEKQPEFEYCWVQAGFHGRYIKFKSTEGWEVVQGDMPEARELKGMGMDTTRRLGDVILMRMQKDRYLALKRRREAHQRAVETGITTELEELGAKYRDSGLLVHTKPDDQLLKRMASGAAARQMAGQRFDTMIRTGTVPGVTPKGG